MTNLHLLLLSFLLFEGELSLGQSTLGVTLMHNETEISNHDMLALSSGSIFCHFGSSEESYGEWYSPPGPIGLQPTALFTQQESGGVLLIISEANFTVGLYQCLVQEADGVEESVFVGLYTPSTYQENRGPIVQQDITFTLQAPRYQQPSIYNLSIVTMGSPATYVSWKYYNDEIDETPLFDSYRQQREVINALSCTTKTTLTITGSFSGLFSLTVANPRTKDGSIGGVLAEKGESAIFVKAAPSSPTAVRVVQIDPSSVSISWSHNTGTEVLGYEVYVCKEDTGSVASHDVPGATNVNLVLASLQVNTEYKIWLVAYGEHLPSLPTEPIGIELNGTCSIILVSTSYTDSGTLQLEWVPDPATASLVTVYDVCTTQGSNLTCTTTTTTSYTLVSNLDSGETMLVQVRAHTSAGPGQFYNVSVAQFPTISVHLAMIVGGASLSAGAVLGALLTVFLALSFCQCYLFCVKKGREKKRRTSTTEHQHLTTRMSQISVEEYEEEDELSNNSANVYEEVHIPPSSSALDEIEKKAC